MRAGGKLPAIGFKSLIKVYRCFWCNRIETEVQRPPPLAASSRSQFINFFKVSNIDQRRIVKGCRLPRSPPITASIGD
jgi:hypothetical protein